MHILFNYCMHTACTHPRLCLTYWVYWHCSDVNVSRVDILGLDNLYRCSSWRYIYYSSPSRHKLSVALHLHVSWCCHYASHLQASVWFSFYGCRFLGVTGEYYLAAGVPSSDSYNLSIPPPFFYFEPQITVACFMAVSVGVGYHSHLVSAVVVSVLSALECVWELHCHYSSVHMCMTRARPTS